MAQPVINMQGKYGQLTILERIKSKDTIRTPRAWWKCRCDCGVVVELAGALIRSGSKTHCGDKSKHFNIKHGHARVARTSPTYRSYYAARTRCTNPLQPGWENYGGRGIKMCERWFNSFPSFLEDMGERPEGNSLDRIDNNKDYEPGNCKWSTRTEQNRNSRRVVMTQEMIQEVHRLKGTMSQPKIAKLIGASVSTVSRTIRGVSWA